MVKEFQSYDQNCLQECKKTWLNKFRIVVSEVSYCKIEQNGHHSNYLYIHLVYRRISLESQWTQIFITRCVWKYNERINLVFNSHKGHTSDLVGWYNRSEPLFCSSQCCAQSSPSFYAPGLSSFKRVSAWQFR